MNIVEYMNNQFYLEIQQKYQDNICPVCGRTPLSNRKNHIIPKGFHKRISNSMLTSTDQSYVDKIHELIPPQRLRNGISINGLWCDNCEDESAKYDDKFISFMDSGSIYQCELIHFIRLTCLRFYLMLIKPHNNIKTQEFADLLSILKKPSYRLLMSLMEMENPISQFDDKFIPEIYICKVKSTNISLSYPKLHNLVPNEDERVSLIVGDLFINIFIGNSHINMLSASPALTRFKRLIKNKNLTIESLLYLAKDSTRQIHSNEIPLISTEQMLYLILGE